MSEASLGILHNYALVVASLKHHGNAYNANSLRSQRNSGANALLAKGKDNRRQCSLPNRRKQNQWENTAKHMAKLKTPKQLTKKD